MNLIGQQFGGLLVKEISGANKWGHTLWLCECKCGKTALRKASALKSAQTSSCGCQRRIYNEPIYEMVGKKFGRLEVKEFVSRGKRGEFYWKCVCECGGEKTTNGSHLRQGVTKSCGCLHKEATSRNLSEYHRKKPKRKPAERRTMTREEEIDRGYYRVNSKPHEQALAAAGISFA
jgi:hypothetical protein